MILAKRTFLVAILFFGALLLMNGSSLAKDSPKQSVLKQTKALYIELMSFKDDHEFHRIGFKPTGKYNKWLKKVNRLEKNPNSRLIMEEGICVGDLKMLGLEYAKHGGRETKYSKYMNNEFLSVFGK